MNDIVKTMNEKIFDIVLGVNAEYVKRVEAGASAEEQEALLAICGDTYKKLILNNGLNKEYKEYAESRRAHR